MGLKSFFHKIKIGFARMGEPSLPYTTQAKKYGDWGEDEFVYAIQSRLPDCKIKKNTIIQTTEGNAEIDCLILYKNKLFAIEIKRWKGRLVDHDGNFIQYKRDRWTGEIHTKAHKSPFKQLSRAVYLLRKQIPDNAWINTVVFFEELDYIETESDNVWFDNVDKLISHIVSDGKSAWGNNASAFFEKCIAADYLYSNFVGYGGKFCVSVFRQNQEYHVFNMHDGGLFPLVNFLPAGWDGMRAAGGVNAVSLCREYYFKRISLPCGRRT